VNAGAIEGLASVRFSFKTDIVYAILREFIISGELSPFRAVLETASRRAVRGSQTAVRRAAPARSERLVVSDRPSSPRLSASTGATRWAADSCPSTRAGHYAPKASAVASSRAGPRRSLLSMDPEMNPRFKATYRTRHRLLEGHHIVDPTQAGEVIGRDCAGGQPRIERLEGRTDMRVHVDAAAARIERRSHRDDERGGCYRLRAHLGHWAPCLRGCPPGGGQGASEPDLPGDRRRPSTGTGSLPSKAILHQCTK
jgi:hypothetical protein